MYVYLFTCQIKSVLKFGMTNEANPMKRIGIYSGLNRPNQILCLARTEDDTFEHKFKVVIDKHPHYERAKNLGHEWIKIPINAAKNYDNDYKDLAGMFYKILKNNI